VGLRQAVKCACGKCPPDHYHVAVDADYVHESVTSFDESCGAPGAPIRKEAIWLSVPRSLLKSPTERAFKDWARKMRQQKLTQGAEQAIKTIAQLKKKFHLQ
jgi:hypothetical protein